MITQIRGLTYAFICVILYAIFSIFFKVVSDLNLHSMLFITISMMFASLSLLIKGGHNRLIFEALKSTGTWVYSITFILIFIFSIELLKYISATEMILASRLNIIFSLIFALIFLKRNTLEKGIYGVPFIVIGLIIMFSQVENSLLYVLLLGICSSLSKCGYFFSIELNKTGYKSKNYLDDFGILGFILGLSSLIALIFMIFGSVTVSSLNIETRLFPTYSDFANPTLFILAGLYGLLGFTALRYLEFKSIQSIKSEVFMCMITLVPLITLVFESCANFFGILNSDVNITPPLLLANVLIITGGLLIVILKVLGQELSDEADRQYLLKMVRSTEVFANHDLTKAARVLEVSKEKLEDILNNKNFTVLKSEFKHIQNCFNKKVAMADHLTGLCNRLEFITELKHIDKKSTASLFFIDLNKFKPVNDTYGHDAGDFILSSVARRLENIFAESTLTRMGGDEFSLLVKGVDSQKSNKMLIQIQEEISKPYYYKGTEINISASVGFANYPDDTSNPINLLKIADEKMFLDKDNSTR